METASYGGSVQRFEESAQASSLASFFRFDALLLLAGAGLIGCSVFVLSAATTDDVAGSPYYYVIRQSVYGGVGILMMLALSRFEANDAPIKGQPIDVAAMAALLRKDVLARATHPRNVELAMDSDARLQGDEAMVQSAFSNLVDNAAKYTPSEGSMLIRWWTDGEGAHFSVRDTGPGIPAEHLPRLTERFYRVDPARSRETGGSGLGLAIVKHALHRHGGSLDIESIPGRGSTFTCHFPPERILERRVAASA